MVNDRPDFIPSDDDWGDSVDLPDVLGSTPDTPDTPVTGEAGEAPEPLVPKYGEGPEEEMQPEEAAVENIYDLIPIAIQQRRHLQITYTGVHSGLTKDYTIEPYEVGGHRSIPAGFLWGWDIAVGTIKSFYLSNISDIQLLSTLYVPRF